MTLQPRVRPITAILVKENEDIREWSRELNDWTNLNPSGMFDDRTLTVQIPIRALLDRAEAIRVVVRALYTQQNPAILEIERAGLKQGRAEMA